METLTRNPNGTASMLPSQPRQVAPPPTQQQPPFLMQSSEDDLSDDVNFNDGGEHPLQNKFCFWFMRRGGGAGKPRPTEYEKSIKKIGIFSSVEGFWQLYNHLVRPNDVPHTTDYHLFQAGIKPIWEDPANKKGGKWIVRLKKGLASRYWESILLAIIGEQFDVGNEICGAVISVRHNEDILALWNRNADDAEVLTKIRDSMKKVLRLPSFVTIEYKPHDQAIQDNSSFRNTSVWRNNPPREGAVRGNALNPRGEMMEEQMPMYRGNFSEENTQRASGSHPETKTQAPWGASNMPPPDKLKEVQRRW